MSGYFKNISEGIKSTLTGMRITFKHALNARKRRSNNDIQSDTYFNETDGLVSVQYPLETIPIPDNGRYRLNNEIDDCIVCDKCAKVCPVNCIDIEAIKATEEVGKASDGSSIRLYAAKFDIDMAKCCYCGLCTTVCPTECLTMTKTFDYSEFDVRDMLYAYSNLSEDEAQEKRDLLEQFQKEKEALKASKTSVTGATTSRPVIPGVKKEATEAPAKPKFQPGKSNIPTTAKKTTEEQPVENKKFEPSNWAKNSDSSFEPLQFTNSGENIETPETKPTENKGGFKPSLKPKSTGGFKPTLKPKSTSTDSEEEEFPTGTKQVKTYEFHPSKVKPVHEFTIVSGLKFIEPINVPPASKITKTELPKTAVVPAKSASTTSGGKSGFKPTMKPANTDTNTPKPAFKPKMKPTITTEDIAPVSKQAFKPTMKPANAESTAPAAKPAFKPTMKPANAESTAPAAKPAFKPTMKPANAESTAPAAKPAFKPNMKPVATPIISDDSEEDFPTGLTQNKTYGFHPSSGTKGLPYNSESAKRFTLQLQATPQKAKPKSQPTIKPVVEIEEEFDNSNVQTKTQTFDPKSARTGKIFNGDAISTFTAPIEQPAKRKFRTTKLVQVQKTVEQLNNESIKFHPSHYTSQVNKALPIATFSLNSVNQSVTNIRKEVMTETNVQSAPVANIEETPKTAKKPGFRPTMKPK